MTRRVAVRGIVLHEGKLLCARLKAYKEKITSTNNHWCLPGGGLDDGEALVAGLEREMLEETGILAAVGNLLYVQQFTHGGQDHLEFFFHITNAKDYLHIDLSKTANGLEEIEEIDFVDPTTIYILPEFLKTEKLAEHAASDMSPKIFSTL